MKGSLAIKPSSFYRRASRSVRKQTSLQRAWSGIVFRSVPIAFANREQIVDGVGAKKSGGRWNRPHLGLALYCSLKPGTAAEESMRLFEAAGFKRKAVKPRVIVGIRYELGAVIEVAELIRSIEGAELSRLFRRRLAEDQ